MKKLVILLCFLLTLTGWAQSVNPPNQSRTNDTRPTISANFNTRVYRAKMWMDGGDYSRYLRINGSTVSMVPPNPLRYGTHQVKMISDRGVVKQWTFQVANNNNNNNNNNNKDKHNNRDNEQNNRDHDKHDNNDNAVGWTNNGPNRTDSRPRDGVNTNNGQPVRYDNAGRPIVFDSNGRGMVYDSNGNPVTYDNGQPITYDTNGQRTTYNSNGQPVTYNNNGQPVRYDNNGRPITWSNNGQQGYANHVIDVSRYAPSSGSTAMAPRPAISAAFSGQVQNLRMIVDGRDVTSEATVGNEGISWVPRTNLNRGQHTATVTGTAQNGQPVSGEWNFRITY